MASEVRLPQLGESVTEGTITAWLVKQGDRVEEDQPLFEISTEKIDTEVPSPATGILKEIRAQVDDTVEVGTIVAVIQTEEEAAAEAAVPEAAAPAEAQAPEETPAPPVDEAPAGDVRAPEGERAPAAAAQEEAARVGVGGQRVPDVEREPAGDGRAGEQITSPIVRRLIREHDLDPAQIEGTGKGGRITREDVERAIRGLAAPAREERRREEPAPTPAEPTREERRREEPAPVTAALTPRKPFRPEARSRTESLSRVRRAIARGMWESLQTTAQLTAGIDVDVSGIMRLRERAKEEFRAREGVPLSPLPFFARAVCMVLPRHPQLNAAIDVEQETATYYDFINLGVAVDAEQGLIVPNIKGADDLTLPALARAIADLADRTRSRRLQPDEVHGATFTITNTGSRGVLFDTPILNPPEVAILATPKIQKKPVVVHDERLGDIIAIRSVLYLCLTYDHRMVDGADAARFLTDLKQVLENHDFGPEVSA